MPTPPRAPSPRDALGGRGRLHPPFPHPAPAPAGGGDTAPARALRRRPTAAPGAAGAVGGFAPRGLPRGRAGGGGGGGGGSGAPLPAGGAGPGLAQSPGRRRSRRGRGGGRCPRRRDGGGGRCGAVGQRRVGPAAGDAMGSPGGRGRPAAPLLPLLVPAVAVLAAGAAEARATSESQLPGAAAMGTGTPPSPSGTAFEETRLHVFTLDYPHVQIPFEITLWILLASLAKIGERGRRRATLPSPPSAVPPYPRAARPPPRGPPGAAALGPSAAGGGGRGWRGGRRVMLLGGAGCPGVIWAAKDGVFSFRSVCGGEERSPPAPALTPGCEDWKTRSSSSARLTFPSSPRCHLSTGFFLLK